MLALLLLEIIFTGLSHMGGVAGRPWIGLDPRTTSQERLSSILFQALQGDFEEFEEYCRQEADWEEGVAFLDAEEKAGWKVLTMLFTDESLDLTEMLEQGETFSDWVK